MVVTRWRGFRFPAVEKLEAFLLLLGHPSAVRQGYILDNRKSLRVNENFLKDPKQISLQKLRNYLFLAVLYLDKNSRR